MGMGVSLLLFSLLSLLACAHALSLVAVRPSLIPRGLEQNEEAARVADEESAKDARAVEVNQDTATYESVAASTDANTADEDQPRLAPMPETPPPPEANDSANPVTDKEYREVMRHDGGCDDQVKKAEGLPPTNLIIAPKRLLEDGTAVVQGQALKTKVLVSNDGPFDSDDSVEEEGDDADVTPVEEDRLTPTNRFIDQPPPSKTEEADAEPKDEVPEQDDTGAAAAPPDLPQTDQEPAPAARPKDPCDYPTANALQPTYHAITPAVESIPVLGMKGAAAASLQSQGGANVDQDEDELDGSTYSIFNAANLKQPETTTGPKMADMLNMDDDDPADEQRAGSNDAAPTNMDPSSSSETDPSSVTEEWIPSISVDADDEAVDWRAVPDDTSAQHEQADVSVIEGPLPSAPETGVGPDGTPAQAVGERKEQEVQDGQEPVQLEQADEQMPRDAGASPKRRKLSRGWFSSLA